MLAAIARAVARRPWFVVGGWLVVAGILFFTAPPLRQVVTQDNAAFLSDEAPSVVAGKALAGIWPEDEIGNTGAIVFRRDTGLTPGDEQIIRSIESWLRSDQAPDVVLRTQSPWSRPELRDVLLSGDRKVAIVIVGFRTPPFQPSTNEAVMAIRNHVRAAVIQGLEVHVTGNAGVGADQDAAITQAVEQTTRITIVLVTLILIWVYRSPITPLVPLLTVGIALGVSRGVVALLAQAGLQVSSLVETFMVVIIFGAGTDYCLFIVSRYKEELAERALGRSVVAGGSQEAGSRGRRPTDRRTLAGTMAIIGAVIASSAATVVVGFAAQSAARFGMYRTTGPAMAIAVLITVTAGLTLTPALLGVIGPRAFWPWTPEKAARARGRRST